MKFLINSFLIVLNCIMIYSQHETGGELFIYNRSTQNVVVRVYPVSSVFNNDRSYPNHFGNYNLVMTGRSVNHYPLKDFISATSLSGTHINRYWTLLPLVPFSDEDWVSYGFDDAGGFDGNTAGTIGFGIWRIEFFWNCFDPEDIFGEDPCLPDDFVTVEYDFGYINPNRQTCNDTYGDLEIRFTDYNQGHPRIQYFWRSCRCTDPNYHDVPYDRKLYERTKGCTGQNWDKELGDFKYNNGRPIGVGTPNPYTIMPLDPRVHSHKNYFPQSNGFDERHFYVNDEIGKIILNLTIEKNITTPLEPWSEELPSFPPIIITNDATLKLAKGSNGQERTLTFNKYTVYNEGTDLYIQTNGTFLMEGAPNQPEHRTKVILNRYCDVEVEQNGWLTMGTNSIITMNNGSSMYWFPNSHIYGTGYLNSVSKIEIKTGAIIRNCGAIIHEPLNRSIEGGEYKILDPLTCWTLDGPLSITHTIDSGGSINISEAGILTIEKNCNLIFDGTESHLSATPGTSIILGEGASIEFRNGAYLEANGCTFTSINSGEIWNGIVLDGSGSQTNIQNCTFNDAATSISVTNTVCNISGNTFNINNNTNCVYGISAVNENNITISSNTFNAGSNPVAECIKFFNYDGDGLPGGGGIPSYSLNIFNNVFNGGVYPIDIQCLTASQLPFYISYNHFYPVSGVSSNGIFAYNITGNLKNNVFHNSYNNKSLSLQFTSVNLYNNTFQSVYQNI